MSSVSCSVTSQKQQVHNDKINHIPLLICLINKNMKSDVKYIRVTKGFESIPLSGGPLTSSLLLKKDYDKL